MSWDGGGTFDRVHNFSADASAGIQAQAARFDAEFDEVKAGLENTVTLTGETTPTANQPMGGYRHIGVGAATSSDNYLRADDYTRQTAIYLSGVVAGGGGVVVVSTSSPFLASAPADGQQFVVLSSSPGSPGDPILLQVNPSGQIAIRNHDRKLIQASEWNVDSPNWVIFNASASAYILMNPSNLPSDYQVSYNAIRGTNTVAGGGTMTLSIGRIGNRLDCHSLNFSASISISASTVKFTLPSTLSSAGYPAQRTPITIWDGAFRAGELFINSGSTDGSCQASLYAGAMMSGTGFSIKTPFTIFSSA